MSTKSRTRSKTRLSRALGIALTPKAARYLEKRPYGPGQHGRTKRKADSDYAVRLREKQRLRAQYGIREAQLRTTFNEARRQSGLTGENLVELLEMPELATDPRFESNPERVRNNPALEAALAPKLRTRSVATWIEALEGAGIPAGPVLRVDQTLAHPQLAARDMIVDLPHPTLGSVKLTGVTTRLSETPGAARRHPPMLGEHTREVLAELGLEASSIESLLEAGAAVQG